MASGALIDGTTVATFTRELSDDGMPALRIDLTADHGRRLHRRIALALGILLLADPRRE